MKLCRAILYNRNTELTYNKTFQANEYKVTKVDCKNNSVFYEMGRFSRIEGFGINKVSKHFFGYTFYCFNQKDVDRLQNYLVKCGMLE